MLNLRTLAASAVVGVALAAGGCASDSAKDVPGSAHLTSQGMGPVTFTAPDSGTAYVYDSADDYVVWSGPVHRGQTINVDTDDRRVMVDGRVAAGNSVIKGHRHKIYFDDSNSARLAADRDTGYRDRDVVVKDGDVTVRKESDGNVTVHRDQPDVVIKHDAPKVRVETDTNSSGDTTVRKETTVRDSDGTTVTRERTIEKDR